MIRAAIVPGSQPKKVRNATSSIEPQPLSTTASGGKMMHRRILKITPIFIPPFCLVYICTFRKVRHILYSIFNKLQINDPHYDDFFAI